MWVAMRILVSITILCLLSVFSLAPALAGTFEGTVKSNITSKGRTAEVTSYFKGARARAEVSVSGTQWLTLVIDTESQVATTTDHLKKKTSRHTFAEWSAAAAKKPKRKKGPLVRTELKSDIAGYPVEKYVHTHEDGTAAEVWVTSQLPLSPLLLQTIGELCSGQPLDDQVAQFINQGLVIMKIERRSADGSVVFLNEITEVRSQSLSANLFKISDPT
jgi:hypothetical protein